jgi:hypothetical protein
MAVALKRENPARTGAQVRRILRTQMGWAPGERTLQRWAPGARLGGLLEAAEVDMLIYRMFTQLLSWMALCARSDTTDLPVSPVRAEVLHPIRDAMAPPGGPPAGEGCAAGAADDHRAARRTRPGVATGATCSAPLVAAPPVAG